ncbi:DsbA family protein [Pseudorhodoplanes sp.]|uniref:DsbA family protein n=1 Tax=Pseudorhodoplanes sp. TaxID=1934341 RepID=UPI002BC3B449|nr:DsbA family protein [Pseudorhodoplanes sp.]HWV52348.1 DsbA family protein [Pseudorhodoplanes sp.]
MNILSRLLAALTVAFAVVAGGAAQAQSFTPEQRGEIEAIIKDYFIKHPEMIEELQALAQTEKLKRVISENKQTLFESPRHVTLGNPKGDVTMVEFFDYNCGFCKRALDDMMTLIKDNPNLRVVLKEMPVLSQGSMDAAQVAVAVALQDKSGKRYLDFHQKLLGGRGQADKARALAVAKEVGADMARIEKDMNSPEVKTALQESFGLAEALGFQGTPSYVIGNEAVVGAVGVKELQAKINTARCGKATC